MTRLPSERPAAPNHRRTASRALAAKATALFHGGDPVEIAERDYPGDRATIESVKRGAVVPTATTTTNAPVSTTLEIVGSILSPTSVLREIIARSINVDFGNAGALSIPYDIADGSGTAFIEQGAPIPMSQLSLAATPMSPKKVATGAVLTRELATYSNGEAFITRLLAANVTLGLETLFFDATAGSAIRPAGLKNGIAATAADADDDIGGMMNDLANLGSSVAAVGSTNIAFVASIAQYIKLKTRLPADFAFPIFPSAALADGQVAAIALDAIAIAGQGDVQISVSKTGAVLMNTVAAHISTVGTPNAVAAPVRSLEQTDCIGIRVIADIDWALRNSGGFAWTENVAWG